VNVKIKVISIIGKSRLTETEDAEKIVCAVYACCEKCGRKSGLHETYADAIREWNGD
jgi:hypothetical protein